MMRLLVERPFYDAIVAWEQCSDAFANVLAGLPPDDKDVLIKAMFTALDLLGGIPPVRLLAWLAAGEAD
jgi:hypothetical protein